MAAMGLIDTGADIGIIGYGWVGKAVGELFPEAIIYDEPQIKRNIGTPQALEETRRLINDCYAAFVCVPTPSLSDGSLDTSIVEAVVDWCEADLIIIRSTVNPGTCNKLVQKTGKRIVYQPEYIGETTAHPLLDEGARTFLVLGGLPENRRDAIEVYQQAYNANISIRQTTFLEAEVIKLSENRAIAWKVAQCQELYDACEAAGVDYYAVREAVYGDDPRFNLWFTFVYPEKRGMNSKCIPKDVLAWSAWAVSVGYQPEITDMLLEKNEEWLDENS